MGEPHVEEGGYVFCSKWDGDNDTFFPNLTGY